MTQRRVTVAEMAVALRFSEVHLRRLWKAGKIPAPVALGGRKLTWPTAVFEELTSARGTAA